MGFKSSEEHAQEANLSFNKKSYSYLAKDKLKEFVGVIVPEYQDYVFSLVSFHKNLIKFSIHGQVFKPSFLCFGSTNVCDGCRAFQLQKEQLHNQKIIPENISKRRISSQLLIVYEYQKQDNGKFIPSIKKDYKGVQMRAPFPELLEYRYEFSNSKTSFICVEWDEIIQIEKILKKYKYSLVNSEAVLLSFSYRKRPGVDGKTKDGIVHAVVMEDGSKVELHNLETINANGETVLAGTPVTVPLPVRWKDDISSRIKVSEMHINLAPAEMKKVVELGQSFEKLSNTSLDELEKDEYNKLSPEEKTKFLKNKEVERRNKSSALFKEVMSIKNQKFIYSIEKIKKQKQAATGQVIVQTQNNQRPSAPVKEEAFDVVSAPTPKENPYTRPPVEADMNPMGYGNVSDLESDAPVMKKENEEEKKKLSDAENLRLMRKKRNNT